jgi:hypothetical protein
MGVQRPIRRSVRRHSVRMRKRDFRLAPRAAGSSLP